jgi:uncharacterized protein YjiS (DUF1127 family)
MAAPVRDRPALDAASIPVAPPLAAMRRAAGATLRVWGFRLRTRAALRDLEAARLADLGLSAAEARQEADKPFWRA